MAELSGIRPLSDYALIIDARTPNEFAEDHLPGAVNLPVVTQEEFAEVGTLHRTDPHAAYLLG
ncbi:MAG: rhodanese-like domain-containing protein, partial [Inhella sp.]